MPVIDRPEGVSFEVWHDGVLVAIVCEGHILVNSAEDVLVIFNDKEENKAWMS